MPATGPSPTRRALLLCAAAVLARAADAAEEAWETIAAVAAGLGKGSEVEFLSFFDPQLPGYSTLRANIRALIAAADAESAIDPVGNSGDDQARDLEVDWQVRLVGRSGFEAITTRRDTIKCRLEKQGRKWKIVKLEPLAFFSPPSARADLADKGSLRVALL